MNIPRTLLHYEIREQLGAGGMGEVYRAWDSKLDREVALKILPADVAADPERTRRFQHEAKAVAALNHPHIVTVYSVEEDAGIHFLTMELVEGRSLDTLIPQGGMPLTDLLGYAIPLADAVASAHEHGIIHRDLKPRNAMVDTKGRLKVLDFGLAKIIRPALGPEDATQSMTAEQGRIMGTVGYMSPEQAQGQDVDPRSDVFSLGVMLYEMATGENPFRGDTPVSTISSILKDDPAPVHEVRSQLPPELSRILRRALAKDPERRYQTALGLRNDLQALEEDLKTGAGKRRSRRRYLIPAAILAALLAVFLVANPLKLKLGINQPEAAAKDRLAVLHFENLTTPDDPERLGEIVSNLLITSLSQSEHLSVVSSERLQELVKRRGKKELKDLDRQTATEVAVQAGAKTMLLGSILKSSPYVVTYQLVDAGTGDVLRSQRVDGEAGEEIFALVDRLGAAVKRDLDLPNSSDGHGAVGVASVTTKSLDAYRLYLRAREKLSKFDESGTKKDLEAAIAIDTTFAMAYFALAGPSLLEWHVTTVEEQKQAAMQAARLADRVTPRERRYIRSRFAQLDGRIDDAIAELKAVVEDDPDETTAYVHLAWMYWEGKLDRQAAIQWLNRLLAIDPTDPRTYNFLTGAYWGTGDFEQAVWAVNQEIRLAPDDPNSYDTRGEFYAWMGDLDKAVASYEAAHKLNPDWGTHNLAYVFQEMGNLERARAIEDEVGAKWNKAPGRAWHQYYLSDFTARSGRLADTIESLTQALDAAERDGYLGRGCWYLLNRRARMHQFRKEFDLAETDARRALDWARKAESTDNISFWADLVVMLAQRGDFEAAQEELVALKEHAERLYPRSMFRYWMARGWVEMERGDLKEACSSLEECVKREQINVRHVSIRYSLGVAYRKAGRGEEAVRELERVARGAHFSEASIPVWSALSYYQLGRAYEEVGRRQDAAAEYESFLKLFKDADPVFDEVTDARSRLAHLRAAS